MQALSKILLLEDDKLFGETIEDFLDSAGFDVILMRDQASAEKILGENRFDLLIFDINLPDGNGIELLRSLRRFEINTPVLFLTSFVAKEKLTSAFNAGADDYMTKPIDLDELLLRVQALLRRSTIITNLIDLKSGLSFDLTRSILYKDGIEQDLPKMCMKLLALLVKNLGKTVTMAMIEDELYSYGESASYGAIRVYINTIKKVVAPNVLTNLRGVGYRLEKP